MVALVMRIANPKAVTSALVVSKVTTANDERFCSVITPRLSCPHTSDALLRKLQNTWRAKVAHPGTGRRLARQLVPAGDLKQFSSGRVQLVAGTIAIRILSLIGA